MPTGLQRYDPIRWSDMGGWGYDSASIKEADDGDFVKFDDVSSLAAENALLAEQNAKMRSALEVYSQYLNTLIAMFDNDGCVYPAQALESDLKNEIINHLAAINLPKL